MPDANDRRTDFLWLVTNILPSYREDVIGWAGTMGDAVAASYRIPAGMTARDAALDFCAFESAEFNGGERSACPSWMSQLQDPRYS